MTVDRGFPRGIQRQAALFTDMLRRIAALERASSSGGGGGGGTPLGTIIDYYGTGPPNADYLECDGSTFDPLTYPDLNTHLGGNTLPDLRDRSTVGAGGKFTNGQTAGDADAAVVAHTHDFTTDNDTHNHSTPDHSHSAQLQHVGWSGRSTGSGGATVGLAQQNIGGNVQWSSSGIRQNGNSGGGTTGNDTHNHDGTTDSTGVSATDRNYHPVYAVRKCIKAVT